MGCLFVSKIQICINIHIIKTHGLAKGFTSRLFLLLNSMLENRITSRPNNFEIIARLKTQLDTFIADKIVIDSLKPE